MEVAGRADLAIGFDPAVEGTLTPLLTGAGGLGAAVGIFLTSAPTPLADPGTLIARHGDRRELITLFSNN